MAEPPTADSSPSDKNVALSYLLVAAAAAGAWLIYTRTDPAPLVTDLDAFTVFAPLYIVAQAIERFLEPLAAQWHTTTAEKLELKEARGEKATLAALQTQSKEELETANASIEVAELKLGKAKSQRAITLWAAASVLGLLACAALGLGLVAAVSESPPSSEFVRTVDVMLTGLAVGAGTKPLHDLIARLEKAKENADPATKPGTAV